MIIETALTLCFIYLSPVIKGSFNIMIETASILCANAVPHLGYIWFITGLIFLLLELSTPGLFFFVAFAAGCMFASVSAFIKMPLFIQCLIALVSSGIFFFWLRSKFANKKPILVTNINALIKQEGIVTVQIKHDRPGRVRVKSEEWPAITLENTNIEKNTIVKIIQIKGNKLLVSSIK